MDKDFDRQVGERIAELRRMHKMTQATLAEKLDVSPKHISHIERGCASLTIKNLIEIGSLYNVSLDFILLGSASEDVLMQLPESIVNILYSNNREEIERLVRYLKIYEELYKRH